MVWNEQTEEYMKGLIIKAQDNQWLHTESSNWYSKRNTIYTITSLGLTSLTGTLTLITSDFQDNFYLNICMGVILFSSVFLTSVQKMMDIETLSFQHKKLMGQYVLLEQRIQSQLLLNPDEREEVKSLHLELTKAFTEIIKNLPNVPSTLRNKFEKRRIKV